MTAPHAIRDVLSLRMTALTRWNNQMLDAKLAYLAGGSREDWLAALERVFAEFPAEAGWPPTAIQFMTDWTCYWTPTEAPDWLLTQLAAQRLPEVPADTLDEVELVDAYTEVILRTQATWNPTSTEPS